MDVKDMNKGELLAMLAKMEKILDDKLNPKPTSTGNKYVTVHKTVTCLTCGYKRKKVYTIPKGESVTVINVKGKVERVLWKYVDIPLETASYTTCCSNCKEAVKNWQRWYLEEQFLKVINIGITAVEGWRETEPTRPYIGDVQLSLPL